MNRCIFDLSSPMSTEPDVIRVLLIEHNRILREGLIQLLLASGDMALAGAAGSGATGMSLFEEERPAVTVIDLELPDMPAVEVVGHIRSLDPGAPILILATYEFDPAGRDAILSGAAAIIAKDQVAATLAPLIRRVSLPRSR